MRMRRSLRDLLADALGVVVVDVGRDRADDGDHDRRARRRRARRPSCAGRSRSRAPTRATAGSWWCPSASSRTILSGHGAARLISVSTSIAAKHDDEPTAVRPHQFAHEGHHRARRAPATFRRSSGAGLVALVMNAPRTQTSNRRARVRVPSIAAPLLLPPSHPVGAHSARRSARTHVVIGAPATSRAVDRPACACRAPSS